MPLVWLLGSELLAGVPALGSLAGVPVLGLLADVPASDVTFPKGVARASPVRKVSAKRVHFIVAAKCVCENIWGREE